MKRKKFKVRPVDMCIYIDENIYKPDHDVQKIFEYLQCLFYSLSMKKRYFNTEYDYEQYSLYGATQVYLRLTNDKQFLEDEDKKLPRVKSVLNYIKNVLYPFKVNYQKDTFNEVYKEEYLGAEINDQIKDDIEKTTIANCVND